MERHMNKKNMIVGLIACLAITGMFLPRVSAAQEVVNTGQSVSGTLSTNGESTYYQVSATAGAPLLVMLRGNATAAGYGLEVHEGTLAGAVVGTAYENDAEKSVEVVTPVAGEYFVVVTSAMTGTLTYELLLEQRPVTTLTVDVPLTGQSLLAAGDAAYYEINTTELPLYAMVKSSAFVSDYALELR